jgi:hypothetical protein
VHPTSICSLALAKQTHLAPFFPPSPPPYRFVALPIVTNMLVPWGGGVDVHPWHMWDHIHQKGFMGVGGRMSVM